LRITRVIKNLLFCHTSLIIFSVSHGNKKVASSGKTKQTDSISQTPASTHQQVLCPHCTVAMAQPHSAAAATVDVRRHRLTERSSVDELSRHSSTRHRHSARYSSTWHRHSKAAVGSADASTADVVQHILTSKKRWSWKNRMLVLYLNSLHNLQRKRSIHRAARYRLFL
jgi:hypothetical protein